MSSTAISKASLENRLDNANTKVKEITDVGSQLAVGTAVAFGSGVAAAKLGGLEVFGVPVLPSAGVAAAGAALLGIGGRKTRKTMLAVSGALLYPWLHEQGRKMAK